VLSRQPADFFNCIGALTTLADHSNDGIVESRQLIVSVWIVGIQAALRSEPFALGGLASGGYVSIDGEITEILYWQNSR